MESPVESAGPADEAASFEVRLLGPMTISRNGAALTLPASRKVRALFAYLAVASGPVSRGRLCELLWDVPNDPRGELRWCLSKLRRVLDEPSRRRVETAGDTVKLDLAGCTVDALEIASAAQSGVETLDAERLAALSALFVGEFLEGLEIDRNAEFNAWLTAERRRFQGLHLAVLEHLAKSVAGDEVFAHLETWLRLAPFDSRAHEILLTELARRGRIPEGEEHVAVTGRLFEGDGLDPRPIGDFWRRVRTGAGAAREVGTTRLASATGSGSAADTGRSPAARRASIAVMPFTDPQNQGTKHGGGHADGLVHDVITRLAKLRSLFVIAQGTVFALHERQVSPADAGRTLNVDYIVTGTVQRLGKRQSVAVELSETRTARIVWAEVFNHPLDDAFFVLEEIGDRIVASIASEIEMIERNRAILKPPSSLDAWEAYHRGLWHMYRFDKADNDQARHFFEMAVRLDPSFARAHAGLSFTHFQDAFQGWVPRDAAADAAFDAAGQSLMADDRDPAAHWAMGRALWLRGGQDQSLVELETAVDLSPNFALGHYALAFVRAQAGDPKAAIGASDHSRHLSPFDPLLFAMLAARAISLVRMGEFAEAAQWAVRAAGRPNAHHHILAIAAYTLALAGSLDEARAFAGAIRKRVPHYTLGDFLSAFRFDDHGAALFREGARRIGAA